MIQRPSGVSFSFLYRNERTATQRTLLQPTGTNRLSVSSIGTNELQPAELARLTKPKADFQFPLSERTNCNTWRNASGLRASTSFSFLYRNERTATNRQREKCEFRFRFQFPLSERTNCNVSTNHERSNGFCPFSFLYRNERTATRNAVEVAERFGLFQFPLSERTNCNAQQMILEP